MWYLDLEKNQGSFDAGEHGSADDGDVDMKSQSADDGDVDMKAATHDRSPM